VTVVDDQSGEADELASDAGFELRLHRSTAWRQRVSRLLFATDLLAVGIAVLVAYLGRFVAIADFETTDWFYAGLSAGLVAAWMAALGIARAYDTRFLGVGTEIFRRTVLGTFGLFGALAIVAYVFKLVVPRGFVAIALPVGLVLLVIERFGVRKWIQRQRARGGLQHRVVVVGNHQAAEALAKQVRREPFAGFTVVGACLPAPEGSASDLVLPVLGGLEDTLDVVRQVAADTVAVTASPEITPELLRSISWSLEGSGVDLIVAPAVTDVAGPRISIYPVAGLPLLYVDEPTFSGSTRVVKRGIDLVGSGLGLLVLGIPLLVVGGWIRLTSPGPALFRQSRVGRESEDFRVYKFRTMFVDADERKAALLDQNETDGLFFKIADDPRITRPGRFLRRFSIDELPQLINVFVGDMSLVGPRPLPVDDSEMTGHVRRRLLVRPGITGLWQVSGRSDISWEEAVRLDLYYVENWSLSLDFTIFMRTFLAVWRGEGAY
jgi:exopolysaccharide biosynthesis polyprenyl glycosylphosphotransferase